MRTSVPILWPSRGTPAPAQGLRLAIDAAGWIHGALSGAEGRSPGEALGEIFLVAVTEKNQQPSVARLVRQEGFLEEPVWMAQERLVFSVHGSRLFEPSDDRRLVHAAAGKLLSNVAPLAASAKEPVALGDTPGDRLVEAYDRALRGRPLEALEGFRAAFNEPRVEAELDAAHRYNAACCAARASRALRKTDPRRAEELLAAAMHWLEADLRRRAEAHTRGSFAFAASLEDEAGQSRRDELYRAHVRRLRTDPDLVSAPIGDLLRDVDT